MFHKILLLLLLPSLLGLSEREYKTEMDRIATEHVVLDHLNTHHGLFTWQRNRLLGPDGLKARHERFYTETLTWLERWKAMFAKVQHLSQSTNFATADEIRSLLSEDTAAQEDAYKILIADGERLLAEVKTETLALTRLEPVNPARYPETYSALILAYNKQKDQLSQLQNSLMFALVKINGMNRNLQTKFATYVSQQLDKILIRAIANDLEKSLVEALAVLRDEALASSCEQNVNQSYFNFLRYYKYNLYFHMQDTAATLFKTAEAERQRALQSAMTEDFKQRVLRFISLAEQRTRSYQSELEHQGAAAALEYANSILTLSFSKQCRTDPGGPIKCLLLQDMAKLSQNDFRNLSDEELRKMEYTWDQVGPLP